MLAICQPVGSERARLTRYATDGADQEGLTPDEPLQMPFRAGLLSELESQSDESRDQVFLLSKLVVAVVAGLLI